MSQQMRSCLSFVALRRLSAVCERRCHLEAVVAASQSGEIVSCDALAGVEHPIETA
jgi:hypothetical protein